MILVHYTYEIITQESAENGEVEESGFKSNNEALTFRELVQSMKYRPNPSCSRPIGATYEWLESHPEQDMFNGSWVSEAMHYSRDNPERKAKYWRKAMIAAGIVRA